MTWTAIPNSDVDPDSPITTGLMTALRDNVAAQANGDSGSPQQATAGIADNAVTIDKINDVAATQRSGSVAAGALVPFADGYGWYVVQNGAATVGTPEYLSNGTWFTGAVNIGANEAIMFLYTANSRIKNTVGGAITYYWQRVLG